MWGERIRTVEQVPFMKKIRDAAPKWPQEPRGKKRIEAERGISS